MKLSLIGVENIGEIDRERVVMRATEDADAGHYAIFRCRLAPNGKAAAGYVPGAFWFPERALKVGDFVILYSKNGVSSSKTGNEGNTSYFFYWGQTTTQWPGYIATLVETPAWKYSALPPSPAPEP